MEMAHEHAGYWGLQNIGVNSMQSKEQCQEPSCNDSVLQQEYYEYTSEVLHHHIGLRMSGTDKYAYGSFLV